ncbi:hypothetical protein R1sor_004362 [Riccia sorocarpa]|uniref:Uncharacterized protein n=1 Tax=Riccia sorocarpa TaxID=122646 RepID=A0ABD3HIN5_9MARC
MAKSKRKRGNSTGPSITPLSPKAVFATETPLKATIAVPAARSAPKSSPKTDKTQLPTVDSERSLRQYIASAQTQQSSGNQAGFLKAHYLAKVAEWAAATVPNLGAFFGQRLAAASEALAIPPPTSYSLCQRCETVLKVGENCSVLVTKAPKKWRRLKSKGAGAGAGVKNAIVYHCYFCKFDNKTPATAKAYAKAKLAQPGPQMKTSGSSKQTQSAAGTKAPSTVATQAKNPGSSKTSAAVPEARKVAQVAAVSTPIGKPLSAFVSSPMTPSSVADATTGGKKRKRKGWSTLKEMATAQLELPTPSRLGFMSPLNPSKKR